MGFDPTRRWQRRRTDYLFVGLGLAVCAVAIIWGIWG